MTAPSALAVAEAAADRLDWAAAADALDGAPDTDEVLDRRGWYSSRAKRYDRAIEIFIELARRRPHDYRPLYMLGYQYYEQERWAQAIDAFDAALALRPDHINGLWRRAYALHKLGREAAAVATAGKILRAWTALPADKQDAEGRRYAQACHLIGRYQLARDPQGAVELLRHAVRIEPRDPYHRQQLSKALLKSGSPVEALAEASRAAALKPGQSAIELQHAACLAAAGQPEAAVAALRRARRGCSGWTAVRAGRIALLADDKALAGEFARQAAKDRRVRESPDAAAFLEAALPQVRDTGSRSAAPRPAADAGSARPRVRTRTRGGQTRAAPGVAEAADLAGSSRLPGTVQVSRPDRGFGFIVDEAGSRRHFRIRAGEAYPEGTLVTFVPVDARKGPAAQDVRAV